MKKYIVKGWVHPKYGGEDRQFELEIDAENMTQVRKLTENWLKRRSDIITDYTIKETI